MSFEALGSMDNALEAFRRASQLKPDYIEAFMALGRLYRRSGAYQDALRAYKQTARLRPEEYDPHYYQGLVSVDLGRFNDATEYFRQAIRIKADDPRAHTDLGNALLKLARIQEAIESLRHSIKIDLQTTRSPTPISARHIGSWASTIRRPKLIASAIRIDPEGVCTGAQRARGDVYLKMGRQHESSRHWRPRSVHRSDAHRRVSAIWAKCTSRSSGRAKRSRPWSVPRVSQAERHRVEAVARATHVRRPRALARCRRTWSRARSRSKPEDLRARLCSGSSTPKREPPRAGHRVFSLLRFATCVPITPTATLGSARRPARTQRVQEAVETLRTAVRYKPDHAEALAELGTCLVALGATNEAVDAYKRSIALEPN